MTIITHAPYWPEMVNKSYDFVSLGRGIMVCRDSESAVVRFLENDRETLRNERFIGVSCGINHAMLISGDLKLYTVGSNLHGQCGIGTEPEICYDLRFVASGIRLAVAGPSSSFFTTEEGKLFAFGDNQYGQLGVSSLSGSRCVSRPIQLNFPGRICSLSSGYTHTCLISDGVLYGCGFNSHGQLDFLCGRNERIECFSASEGAFSFTPRKVSCGTWNTIIVSTEGDLYMTGQAPEFQTRPQSIPEILQEHEQKKAHRARLGSRERGFLRLPFDAKFDDVVVGSSIAIALLSDLRTIWVIDLARIFISQRLPQDEHVKHISVSGRYYSFSV